MKAYAIYFLQEVHCTKDKETLWSSECGYSAIFSSFSNASVGVGILFNNNFTFQILKSYSDPVGRFLLIDIHTENKTLTLANIYAPNNDDPFFFENFYNHLLTFDCGELILGGDFNLVLDVQKDKSGGNPVTHKNCLKKAQYIIDSLDLWRVVNPDTKRFTWRRRKPDIQCRLDLFLLSSSLGTAVTKADILPGLKTDHSLITLSKNKNPRGPCFWKLNTSILLDLEYINLIKKTVNEISEEYENNDEVNAALLWDTMKMKIRSSLLHYSKVKKTKMKSQKTKLELEIISLQKTLEESNLSEREKNQIINEIQIRNLEREEISKHKTRGAILHSKSRWYNEGEKITKYFLSLEMLEITTRH